MVIYGRNTIIEALKSNFQPREVIFQQDINTDNKIGEITSLAKKVNAKISFKPKREIGRIVKTEEHQGVIAFLDFEIGSIRSLADELSDGCYMYISEVTYEHNVGAIIRTAECAGLKGVILPKDVEITPLIAKISTGSLFNIPVYTASIFEVIKLFHKNAFMIGSIERGGTSFGEIKLPKNTLLIIGGEDKSITENIKQRSDNVISIPQFGKTNSLNMSVAAAIIIFEYVRQNL
jgi:tRNA G18 (ribose-2'-O)-methylase SpoU